MKKLVHISGSRKRAVARATLKEGKGKVRVNKMDIKTIQPETNQLRIMEPLLIAGEVCKTIDISVNVFGGGAQSQADASRLAIARGLVEYTGDKLLKQKYLDYDRQLLIGDVRRKETCKPNDSKARAKRQSSKR